MNAFPEYEEHDALGLAGLVRNGELSAYELLEAAIDRVEARNPAVNAVVMELYDFGKKAIDDGLPDGPFRGVPFLMKDLTSPVAGMPMTRGSRFMVDTPPSSADSEHVKRLKRAGLVIFGRTNTPELGLSLSCEPRLYGATRNPWDLARTPGGSSGGAAAAVAARIVPMAHASDAFGSIRAPAACCGLVGLKPTRGRNTFAPFFGEGMGGLATEHAVSLTVRDSAALLDSTRGSGLGDPYVAPVPARSFLDEIRANPGKLRIAWTSKAPNGARVDVGCIEALMSTARLCAELGHHVEECDPELDGAVVVPTFLTLASTNMAVNLSAHPVTGQPARPDQVERISWLTAEHGKRTGAADYMKAIQSAHRIGRQMAAFHADWDVLLTPGLATAPVTLGWINTSTDDFEEYWRRVFAFSPFTVWCNLSGQPALMLPVGQDGDGLPTAAQLIGRYGDEATLFRLGSQLEAARPWFSRKPALCV